MGFEMECLGLGRGFWKNTMRRKIRLVGALMEKIQYYLSLIDIDTADIGKHFQNDTKPRGIVF